MTQVVCDEDGNGAHGKKTARCGRTRETKKQTAKPEVDRDNNDEGGAERGQHNKHGITEVGRNNKTLFSGHSP